MKRRSFLLSTGTIALGQLVVGCGTSQQAALSVQLLNGSIPAQLTSKFTHEFKPAPQLNFTIAEQLKDLYTQLLSWKQLPEETDNQKWQLPLPSWMKSHLPSTKSQPKDLVTLGDYWLAPAIRQGLIQPLEPTQLSQWQKLPLRWQQLVKRNDKGELDPQGKVWAAPYSWGTTVIAYNRDKFKSLGWEPRDWSDLWRTEVRDRLSLLDQAREVIGLTLKKLDKSYNTEQLEPLLPDLERELVALNRQAKFYSSDTYLQPLILGDTWLAVGWSTDVWRAMQRYQQLAAVVPLSGTALWANMWVRPQGVNSSPFLSQKWIDFCWQLDVAQQISRFSDATSPIPVPLNPADIPAEERSLLLNTSQVFHKSEFLLPLSTAALNQYESLWRRIRQPMQ
ncbi:MAG: extracellular solute-binding protein [Chroococcidiopsidaceae cyanobacterium CP_BM_ER_R8_30]|nr:extracellular solute-binding protein [Chroococcidiopsidaceae cyanobacterium CP_BM_ER_R8_30]